MLITLSISVYQQKYNQSFSNSKIMMQRYIVQMVEILHICRICYKFCGNAIFLMKKVLK